MKQYEKELERLTQLLNISKKEQGVIVLMEAIDLCHRIIKYYKLETYSPILKFEKSMGRKGNRRFDLFVKDIRRIENWYDVDCLWDDDENYRDYVIFKKI